MKKSTLTLAAKAIQKLDAELFGMTSGTIEHATAQNARTSLFTLIESEGYRLSLDYKLEQNKRDNVPAGDTEKWANASDAELYKIAVLWAKRYTIKQLRAFQEHYKTLQINHQMESKTEWLALEHRWQCATWAIDYRAFHLNKEN